MLPPWFLGVLSLLQSAGQLIRAGSGLASAGGTLQSGNNVVNVHTLDQRADTLQIAIAAAQELHIPDLSVLDIKIDLAGAGAAGGVRIAHT